MIKTMKLVEEINTSRSGDVHKTFVMTAQWCNYLEDRIDHCVKLIYNIMMSIENGKRASWFQQLRLNRLFNKYAHFMGQRVMYRDSLDGLLSMTMTNDNDDSDNGEVSTGQFI